MNATKNSTWAIFLSLCLVLAGTTKAFAQTDPSISQQPPQAAQQSAEQLQQLVAPIALYPDSLVAQILAAGTYPQEVQRSFGGFHGGGFHGRAFHGGGRR
jgi:Protein of unknown function (DUF3300)